MGLFSKKNLAMAKKFADKNADKVKGLAEKNAGKIAQGVDKATDAVNRKTGGKYADKLKKVDDAAQKFAEDSGHPVGDKTATAAEQSEPKPSDDQPN